ncbi:MAG: hypothetical protein Kow0092_28600 [Deferrisomatales bacterium]
MSPQRPWAGLGISLGLMLAGLAGCTPWDGVLVPDRVTQRGPAQTERPADDPLGPWADLTPGRAGLELPDAVAAFERTGREADFVRAGLLALRAFPSEQSRASASRLLAGARTRTRLDRSPIGDLVLAALEGRQVRRRLGARLEGRERALGQVRAQLEAAESELQASRARLAATVKELSRVRAALAREVAKREALEGQIEQLKAIEAIIDKREDGERERR